MKYNFIHVPKTAGNSLLKVLGTKDIITYHGHIRVKDVNYPNMISFIRNPYDRVVSTYFYLLGGGMLNELDLEYKKVVEGYKDFEEFLSNIEEHGLMDKILHLRPMHYWLCDEQKILPTCFKLEEIEKIDSFLNELGLNSLRDVRENSSKHEDFVHYMTSENKARIYKLYEEDFKIFEYAK